MENNDRRQRQSNQPGYLSQRQPALPLQSPTSGSSSRRTGSAGASAYSNFPYGDDGQFAGMQAGTLQYPQGYSAAAARPHSGQHQQHQYGQYGSSLIYTQPQNITPASTYEPVQRYGQQPQQIAAAEVLSTQFAGTSHYYVPSPGDGPTSAPSSAISPQNVQSQYSSLSYAPHNPVGQARESMASTYAAGLADPTPAQGSSAQYGGQSYSAQAGSEQDAAYAQYQAELRRTNEVVRDGNLVEAGSSLLRVSEWLLGNAENLGLVRDEEALHAERLRLWEDFNHTWLATLQRQKDLSLAGQLAGGQSLMEAEPLRHMAHELVRLCDNMEKHGLVDYQMGVWEEPIMDLLTECLDIVEQSPGDIASSSRRR